MDPDRGLTYASIAMSNILSAKDGAFNTITTIMRNASTAVCELAGFNTDTLTVTLQSVRTMTGNNQAAAGLSPDARRRMCAIAGNDIVTFNNAYDISGDAAAIHRRAAESRAFQQSSQQGFDKRKAMQEEVERAAKDEEAAQQRRRRCVRLLSEQLVLALPSAHVYLTPLTAPRFSSRSCAVSLCAERETRAPRRADARPRRADARAAPPRMNTVLVNRHRARVVQAQRCTRRHCRSSHHCGVGALHLLTLVCSPSALRSSLPSSLSRVPLLSHHVSYYLMPHLLRRESAITRTGRKRMLRQSGEIASEDKDEDAMEGGASASAQALARPGRKRKCKRKRKRKRTRKCGVIASDDEDEDEDGDEDEDEDEDEDAVEGAASAPVRRHDSSPAPTKALALAPVAAPSVS